MNEQFKIVTICSKIPHENYYCLKEWAKSLGEFEPLILGTEYGSYGGLGSKPRLLYKAIKDGLVKEKYLIFCDCFDLVFATSPEKLFEKYQNFAAPLVISAEKNCFPSELKEEYDKLENANATPYKYLNSGMIVGETDAMLAVLDNMGAQFIPDDYFDTTKHLQINPNDQEYWQHEFLKQPVQITLDRYQILCNALHMVEQDELDLTQGRIYNKITKTYPCSFHFNGAAKTNGLMKPILNELNL